MADYTDNFNRANAASPSTNAPYPITTLTGSFELLSNAIHDTDTGAVVDSWCRMEVDFQSSDHEVSTRFSTVTTSGSTAVGGGPMISANTSASVTALFLIADFVAQTATILDLVSGVVTNSYGTSGALGAFAVGDVMTLGRYGSYIYAKKNGTTIIEARSSLYYTGKRGGIYTSRSGAGVDVAINNWHAIDLISPPPTPRAPGLVPALGSGLQSFPPPDTTTATTQTAALSPATVTVTPVAPGQSSAISRALSPATVTVTPVAPARTAAISRALSRATITITPVAPARTAAISRALSPATITVTGVAPARVAAISRALTPATVTITPVALSRTAAKLVGLSPATVTVTAVALARTVGNVSVALSPATVTVTPVGLGVVGGATVTTTPEEPQHGGLGRRGPYTPVEQMRHKQQLIREDEELMMVLL